MYSDGVVYMGMGMMMMIKAICRIGLNRGYLTAILHAQC